MCVFMNNYISHHTSLTITIEVRPNVHDIEHISYISTNSIVATETFYNQITLANVYPMLPSIV